MLGDTEDSEPEPHREQEEVHNVTKAFFVTAFFAAAAAAVFITLKVFCGEFGNCFASFRARFRFASAATVSRTAVTVGSWVGV